MSKNLRIRLIMGLILVATSQRVLSQHTTEDFDYYDRLRTDASLIQSTQYSNTSNVFYVTDSNDNTFRLVDLSCFLPFSTGNGVFRQSVESDAFAILLAIDHFNNMEKSPILLNSLDCNVKLTAELFDTEFSPVQSARIFTEILRRRHDSISTPRPVAVVGAYRSAVTSPLAILSGTNDIVQVSAASTSTDFESKMQFPLFGRTVSSSIGEAKAAVQYFQQYLQATHVGVLFVTDSYGSALQKAFQDAASELDIVTESIGFSFTATPEDIANAVRTLSSTKYRITYAICFETHYRYIMETAYEQGMVGGNFLWMFPGFEVISFQKEAVFPEGSPLIEATRGVGLFQMTGGLVPEALLPDAENVWPLEETPTTGFEKLRSTWRSSVHDPVFADYVRSKIPTDEVIKFAPEPNPLSPFLYDAVTALGLSFCSSGNDTSLFTGAEAYEQFRVQDFDGTSGRVKINNATGTRDFLSMTYVVWNAQGYDQLDEQGNVQFKMAPTNIFQDGSWDQVPAMPFLYGDGGTDPPESLPPVDVDTNQIGRGGQIAGWAVMSCILLLSILSVFWLVWFHDRHVVRSSQPIFLLMVSCGSLIMGGTIVPLSLEEPVSLDGLNAACMASPWLYFTGCSFILSALLAKTRGIHRAYVDPKLEFIHVSSRDILGLFALLFTLNLAMLLVWTLTAPLEWTREFQGSRDVFDRPVESYAVCSSDGSVPFVVVLAVLNVFVLLLASLWAFQSRNIETEFNENRYIGIALASILQAWGMGVPILIVVWSNPPAKFYVQVGIILITSCAVLLLVYVPKVLALGRTAARMSEASSHSVHSGTDTADRRTGFSDEDDQKGAPHEAIPPIPSPVRFSGVQDDGDDQVAVSGDENGPDSHKKERGKLHVVHNPRSKESLDAAGGREVSRGQLDEIHAAEARAAHNVAFEGDNEDHGLFMREELVPWAQSQAGTSKSDQFVNTEKERLRLSSRSDSKLESTRSTDSPPPSPPNKVGFIVPGVWKKRAISIESIPKPAKISAPERRSASEGIKVLHHPRSAESPRYGDGRELSLAQMKMLQEEQADENQNQGHDAEQNSDIDNDAQLVTGR